jgi:hypothetical protein
MLPTISEVASVSFVAEGGTGTDTGAELAAERLVEACLSCPRFFVVAGAQAVRNNTTTKLICIFNLNIPEPFLCFRRRFFTVPFTIKPRYSDAMKPFRTQSLSCLIAARAPSTFLFSLPNPLSIYALK